MSSNPVAAGHTVFCVKFQKEMPGLDESDRKSVV